MKKYFLLFLFITSTLFTEQQELQKKKKNLESLRNEIQEYENKIDENEKKEKTTLEQLDNYEKQAKLLQELINELNKKQSQLRQSIIKTVDNITTLEGEIDLLKKNYSSYVKSVYTNGKTYDFETLISSSSINQLYIRLTYLKSFSDQRRRDLEIIRSRRDSLTTQQNLLLVKLNEEEKLISEKKREEIKTEEKTFKRKKILSTIQKDKVLLVSQMKRKIESMKALENLISTLIEAERIKKEKEKKLAKQKEEAQKRLAKKPEVEKPKPIVEGVFPNKGNLRWPVNSHIIAAGFGNLVHPVLKTVTQNNGIDISVASGTLVKSVAKGEVSMVHWLPSFGNLVIVTHSGEMRTVYANLKTVSVTDGQQINDGEIIGTSGESVEGEILHFELWKEKEKLNPKEWLAKR